MAVESPQPKIKFLVKREYHRRGLEANSATAGSEELLQHLFKKFFKNPFPKSSFLKPYHLTLT